MKVRGVDARGKVVNTVVEWTVADPDMITVSAGEKGQFRVTVTRPGETTLTVASQGVARELVVRAKSLGNAIQVEIRQPSVAEPSQRDAPAPDPEGTDVR